MTFSGKYFIIIIRKEEGGNKTMKEYKIYEVKKARGNQGNCLVCGKEIKAGEAFKRLSAPNPGKVFFCANCKVNQSLIGKNKTDNGKVREVLEFKTKGQAKQIANFITKEKLEIPKLVSQAEEQKQEEEDCDILTNSCLEISKAYCKKCHRSHEVGSRRYERHINFIKK